MQVGDVLRLEKDDFITVSDLCQSKIDKICIHIQTLIVRGLILG